MDLATFMGKETLDEVFNIVIGGDSKARLADVQNSGLSGLSKHVSL